MPYLGVDNLSFSYGTRRVLDGVTLGVDCGELVALVGPNGSGKSTLLRLLTRILTPDSGQAFIGGDPVNSLSPAAMAARVAVVPQETSTDFDFTVFELALMGRTPHLGAFGRESPRDIAVTRNALELTDTAWLADRSIQRISGGERQRVVIARALAQEPEALLLDEPTSHLDINHQADLLNLVHRLCRERQMAILAVLHDLNLACAYADRILVLTREGRIAADGAPAEVITADRVRLIFGAEVMVMPHPRSGRPVVLLEPETDVPAHPDLLPRHRAARPSTSGTP
jgi:iron complex transport system ATP-binding protein